MIERPRKLIREDYEANDEDRGILIACLKIGMPVAQIAARLDVSDRVFRTAYADVLEEAALGGKPEFLPTDQHREIVKLAAAVGIPQTDIGWLIEGISEGTLVKYFRDELRIGKTQANFRVGGTLYQMATGPLDAKNTALAAIWWSKTQMGWKDTTRVEQTGADGGPIKTENAVVVFLPDNGRGDTSGPIVDSDGNVIEPGEPVSTGPEMKAIEDDSSANEDEYPGSDEDKGK